MQELIYKQEAHDKLESMYLKIEAECGFNDVAKGLRIACKAIGEIKEVDTEPVRHGRWIPTEYDSYAGGAPVWDKWECSDCGHEHSGEEDTLTAFCPNCGAQMDGIDINVITKDGGADND